MKNLRQSFIQVSFLLPFIIVSLVFSLIPVIYSLSISFQDFTFLNPANSTFVGLKNYAAVLIEKTFITSLLNTLKYLIAVVPSIIVISLSLAVLLKQKMKLRGFFRSAFYLPYVVSPVAMGVIAVQLFSKYSFLTQFLTRFGLAAVSWHTKAPYAFSLVSIVIVWSQIGFYMVLYLSSLQSIPDELYEASSIDGATAWQKFWYITLPQLRPTTVLVVFMCVLATLQIFDQPYVISTTGLSSPGSPGDTTLSMVMYIYTRAFRYWEMGPASAAAFIVFAIIFIFSITQHLITNRKGEV